MMECFQISAGLHGGDRYCCTRHTHRFSHSRDDLDQDVIRNKFYTSLYFSQCLTHDRPVTSGWPLPCSNATMSLCKISCWLPDHLRSKDLTWIRPHLPGEVIPGTQQKNSRNTAETHTHTHKTIIQTAKRCEHSPKCTILGLIVLLIKDSLV